MNRYSKISTFVLVLALLYAACQKETISETQEPVAVTDEEKAVQGIRVASNSAIAQKDTLKIGSFLSPDFTIITSRSTELKGPENMMRAFATEFANRKDIIYERVPDKIVVYENWKMAAEYGQWTGSWVEPDGKIQLKGSYYAKWHKLNGVWKIRSEVFTPADCNGSAACNNRPF